MKYFLIALLFPLCTYAQSSIDVIRGQADVTFNYDLKQIKGKVNYVFTAENKGDTLKIDARKLNISSVKINQKTVDYLYTDNQIVCWKGILSGENQVEISYDATPNRALYFTGKKDDMRIWTQGQGKDNSHWIPSFDDFNEKVIFGLRISFDKDYTVISNGELKHTEVHGNTKTWHYQMTQPMSSYLLMMAIGKYEHKTILSASQVPIENYYFPDEKEKYAPTYAHTKEIFDFLEETIGVPYPWKVYRNVPVDDFMYGGMENTTSTIFSTKYYTDAIGVNDSPYLNVNAHEMAHQWFGDLITAKDKKDHWLQEGFATYYALLSERFILGEDYFYWKLYEMANKIALDTEQNQNTTVVSVGATTTSYYTKGAWCIFYLSQQIGEDNLQKVVQNFLNKYAFSNASTEDFIDMIHQVVPSYDTSSFEQWLTTPGFDRATALDLINDAPWVTNYIQTAEKQNIEFDKKRDFLFKTLTNSTAGYPARMETIYQLKDVPYEKASDFYAYVAQENHQKLHQALVQIIDSIPPAYLASYRTFLNDSSYLTRELVFKNLWIHKPEKRFDLLNKMNTQIGLDDRNIRITWLMLALKTPNYQNDMKANYYRELENYASNVYNSGTRRNAMMALWFLNPHDSNVLPHLINGLVHHDYRFVQFCHSAVVTI